MRSAETAAIPERAGVLQAGYRLFATPGSLLLSLLFLSALFRPYAGIFHDARLYAVQTIHRSAPELHGEDLYLKYGSQDTYSLFSAVSSPLAQLLGVPLAFFLLYLGGNACCLFAMRHFVPALQGRSLAALGALVYIAVNPLPFGGFRTFHVNENFLTPRIWAVAFVLLGLRQTLHGRSLSSLAWIGGSLLLHPIMGFVGLCIWVAWQLMRIVRWQAFAVLLACAAAGFAFLVLHEPTGTRVFGHIDDRWRELVTGTNLYCVPSLWTFRDWHGVLTAFAIVGCGSLFIGWAPGKKRVLHAVLLVAASGLLVGYLAPFLPYRLLLQGQAYRALWPLQFLQIPVLFALLDHLAKRRLSVWGTRFTGLLAVSFGFAIMQLPQMLPAGVLLAAIYCWYQAGVVGDPVKARVWRLRGWLAAVTGLFILLVLIVQSYPILASWLTPLARIAALPEIIGPLACWVLAICLLGGIAALWPAPGVYRGVTAVGWLAIQTAFFIIPSSTLYEIFGVEQDRDVAFVQDYLDENRGRWEHTPTLYWPLGPLDEIWVRLGCNSFYSIPQTAGNMFNRGTAIEGNRRARLARAFEVDVRREFSEADPGGIGWQVRRVFGEAGKARPTLSDLLALCREEDLDVIVLPNRFEGWYAATNGHLFIYDARQIRGLLETSSSAEGGPGP